MTLEGMKEYLRVDGNDADATITMLMGAAKIYVKNATGYEGWDQENELADLALAILVTRLFDNPAALDKIETLSFGMESLFMQLKYCVEGETT